MARTVLKSCYLLRSTNYIYIYIEPSLSFTEWRYNGNVLLCSRITTMSAQCRHFVQNAWKKELCSNCFKPREEHLESSDTSKPLIKTPHSAFNSNHKVQVFPLFQIHLFPRVQHHFRNEKSEIFFITRNKNYFFFIFSFNDRTVGLCFTRLNW